MTDAELDQLERHIYGAMIFPSETHWRDGIKSVVEFSKEIRRLRAELDAERTKHQELWQFVDKKLDRIYEHAKGELSDEHERTAREANVTTARRLRVDG